MIAFNLWHRMAHQENQLREELLNHFSFCFNSLPPSCMALFNNNNNPTLLYKKYSIQGEPQVFLKIRRGTHGAATRLNCYTHFH